MGNKYGFTLLALVLVTCFLGDVNCGIIGERGNNLTLNPHTRGKVEQVTWTHNGKEVVQYDQQQIIISDHFKRRVVLDLHTGALTIKKLNTEDNGVYESTVVVGDGKTQYSKHDLKVIAAVPEPKVTCNEAGPESEETTLVCSADSDTPVRYSWRGPTVYDQPGPELQLGKPEDLDSVFTCIVKNEISEKHATFTLKNCRKDGIPPGMIAGIVLAVIGVLCLLILIPLVLVCRRKKKTNSKANQSYKQEDVENGENKNLLSPAESTYNGKDEGGTKKKPKGLLRAVHHKKNSGLEDTDDERASFSLRATLPSHAKLQPPRVRHEQANGTFEAKGVNGSGRSSTNRLHQINRSTEKLRPVSVEVSTLDQRAVEVPLSSHGTRLVPVIINTSSASAEHLDARMAVKQDRDHSMDEDEELPNGSPEGVLEEVKPYHSHNVTVTIEGRDRRESLEEEEHVSDTEKGTDPKSEDGVEEEEDEHKAQPDSENNQEEEGREQEKAGEDIGLHVQENHEFPVEESSVDTESKAEVVHSDQTEEEEAAISELKELPEIEQGLKEHLKEDTQKDEKENEQKGQDDSERDSETESIGKEEDSGPVQERGMTAVEEDIITQEQPLRESEPGDGTYEPQEKTELEVKQIQMVDRDEQEPHGNESTWDGEDGEEKSHDGRERKLESAVEQGDDEDLNINQKEEESELRHDPDEDTVSGSSEPEDQLALEAPDASLEAKQEDCQDVSEADEMHGDESLIKLSRTESNASEEDEKQEEPNQLKEGEDQSTPKEVADLTEEQDESLPKYQDIQDVSVMDEVTDEESKIKPEQRTESNPQLEELSEEEKDLVRQDDHGISKEDSVELEEQDSLPEDQKTEEVTSDDDEIQDDQDRTTEIVNNHGQAKDFLEKDLKQVQAEPDQQQSDTESPVVHDNEASTSEAMDEVNTEIESKTHLEEKIQEDQSPTRQGDDQTIPKVEPAVLEEQDQSTDKVISDEETEEDQDQARKTEFTNNHEQPKDSLQELELKQEQAEPDQQQNGANSPVEHENRASTPETKNEEKTESEQENEHSQEEEVEESELLKAECAEKAMDPSDELRNKEDLEDQEEEGEEEERGQTDSPTLQNQPIKDERLTAMSLKEREDDKNVTDSGEDEEKENEQQTVTDLDLAKERSESEAPIEAESEGKKGDKSEVAADTVQEDPAAVVGNERVIAADEKEHNRSEDPVTDNVGDLCGTGKPHAAEEKDVDQRSDRTQKDGQQNSTSDDNTNKVDEKDSNMNANKGPEKEALMEGEREDTKERDEEQINTEVSGRLQNEQSQVEHHDDDDEEEEEEDEKKLTEGEEPGKGNEEEDLMKQMEQANNKNDACENNKDGGTTVPETNGKKFDSQSEKEGKEKEMH